ncbi:hypothetical protein [Pseudarthrobacter sulfonivorans]|uniref:hypothetical protein n=1 Tax=Pseudarthrobacter sulfonivorans TaxID=121292 RepID=UPI00168B20B5|nr:hypothetical protein [Pseudarthrobacter sulfonivorans]
MRTQASAAAGDSLPANGRLGSVLGLQSTAGNRATIAYLHHLPSRTVQRSSDRPVVVQRDDSIDYKAGFTDGSTGQQKNGIPRIDEALNDYNRGYVKGLDERLKRAKETKDWQVIAEVLNAFNIDDIFGRIAGMAPDDLLQIEDGAWRNPRVGKNSQIAQTTHDVVKSIDPAVYSSGAVFPNSFGDKLGGVGGVVIGALAGALALRMAAPLLVGYWRQIQLGAAMSKAAAEADKEDAAYAEMKLGEAVGKLMGQSGGRMLVTYQSAAPAADMDLYVTTAEEVQYADAVAAGRNLYQLRVPERLFQLLQDRGLITIRQGSMGDQVGSDIRIARGAMEFLAPYARQIPIPEK